MKLFLFPPVLWSSILIMWFLQCGAAYFPFTETNASGVCDNDILPEQLIVLNSSLYEERFDTNRIHKIFSCHLHPTNLLKCSWSFLTLETDVKLSVHISLCNASEGFKAWSSSSTKIQGSWSRFFNENFRPDVIIQFNMSLPDSWKVYTYMFDDNMLEVLLPPSNLSASVKDGNLLVTWGLPKEDLSPGCIDYQLDLGHQEKNKNLTKVQSYTELHDPNHTYRVRIRAKVAEICAGGPEWSDWSDTVIVEQAKPYKLNSLVIISISLGLPMILLAVLLLVRNQRVSQLLFPRIPHPPKKFIHFLEKNDTPNFFYPAQAVKVEEEITEVEDSEENIGTKL